MTTFQFTICFILALGIVLVLTNTRSKYPMLSFSDFCAENQQALDCLTIDERKEIYIEYRFHRKQDLLFFMTAHINRIIRDRHV